MKIVIKQGIDEQGWPEEFTDRFPSSIGLYHSLDHLDANGLPKMGSVILEGMVLVGKMGAGAGYDKQNLPRECDFIIYSLDEINRKYPNYFINQSVLATLETEGRVVESRFEPIGNRLCAVVELSPLSEVESPEIDKAIEPILPGDIIVDWMSLE